MRIESLILKSGKPQCLIVNILYSVKETNISRMSEERLDHLPIFAKYFIKNNYIPVLLFYVNFFFFSGYICWQSFENLGINHALILK